MYLPMIPGLCMASRSSPIQAGTRCRDSSKPERGLDLELGSASVSSEDTVGTGITGDTTGTAGQSFITITPTSPTAGRSLIAIISATTTSTTATLITAMPSTEMGTRLFTRNQVHAPARSVGLITAAMSVAFRLAGARALEVAPMEVVSMVAVVGDIADRMSPQVELIDKEWRKIPCCTISRFLFDLNERTLFDL